VLCLQISEITAGMLSVPDILLDIRNLFMGNFSNNSGGDSGLNYMFRPVNVGYLVMVFWKSSSLLVSRTVPYRT
jgi:hypothetical protein